MSRSSMVGNVRLGDTSKLKLTSDYDAKEGGVRAITLMFSINFNPFFGLELDCPTCISATVFFPSNIVCRYGSQDCRDANREGGWSL